MSYDHEKQMALNFQHSCNPEPGDYWDEMFCPVLVVLAATKSIVIYCESRKQTAEGRWTWDMDKISSSTRAEFRARLRYTSPAMSEKTWADVSPGAHKAFSDFFKAALAA